MTETNHAQTIPVSPNIFPTKNKKMTELTQEQLQTIEDALKSIPEDMRIEKYGTMEGIEEQLAEGSTLIFYMTKAEITNSNGLTQAKYAIDKMYATRK